MPPKLKNWDILVPKEEIEKNKYDSLHPEFPYISRILFAAPSGAGKTNALLTLILGEGNGPYISYDEVIIYTRTPQQSKYKGLQSLYDEISKESKIGRICEITNKQIKPVSELDEEKIKVIVFDDLLGCPKEEMQKIVDYFTFGRHKKCHCIYLSQSYHQTPILIRKNCSHFCLYNLPGRRELRTVLIDHGELTEEQYRKNTNDHDFVMINKITHTVKKNFDVPID